MSENIFDATLDVDNDIKVNNFDWSHANNLTTQIGRITPIFCDVVPAKSSFRVNPNFGLQFMPMVFPIQTRMKARISFFRYPLRALWKDYKDFIGNFRDGLEEPFIDFNSAEKLKAMASTGSLGDYLGLPSTNIGSFGKTSSFYDVFNGPVSSEPSFYSNVAINGPDSLKVGAKVPKVVVDSDNFHSIPAFEYLFDGQRAFHKSKVHLKLKCLVPTEGSVDEGFYLRYFAGAHILFMDSENNLSHIAKANPIEGFGNDGSHVNFTVPFDLTFTDVTLADKIYVVFFGTVRSLSWPKFDGYKGDFFLAQNSTIAESSLDNFNELSLDTCPWYNSSSAVKDKQQKILAYSFRAYEGIYNSYFRDNRNNPYYLGGKVQYNTWIPSDAGGADDNLYELRYANWEKDFLTTAVQSPQQGNAPLVGITTYTQTVIDEQGNRKELIKTSLVDEDGKKYGLSFTQNEEGLAGVEYVELDNGTAVRQARSLYDLATSGISIPDLRMVNCYQKFLELNMRKGYSYKDIIEGRFDVKVRYADLLLPEFFGGVSRDIDVNAITQTVDQNVGKSDHGYAGSLGSQSGLAGVRGSANANIECFCDEESVIIGVLVVTPIPVYTQLLPKHFTYRGLMEHYQPEFNLIGFQPIKYNEVCPIQAFNDPKTSLFDTFGYNRPWYEYVQKYDAAHGLFRTSLSNFLMHRVFEKKPELAQSFLVIDPEQVTDVFSVTETTDKIYGQIWLDITAKLPIARVAIPRLD